MKRRKPHSEETKRKIARALTNRKLGLEWKVNVARAIIEQWAKPVVCNETGQTFQSISEAARYYELAPMQVSRVCNGQRNHTHGLSFTFISRDLRKLIVEGGY